MSVQSCGKVYKKKMERKREKKTVHAYLSVDYFAPFHATLKSDDYLGMHFGFTCPISSVA